MIIGILVSKTPYATKKAHPMELTIRSCLMSFLKKDSKTNKLARYPTISTELNSIIHIFLRVQS
jgi:hypothetical protein